jgi:hypothetical protein
MLTETASSVSSHEEVQDETTLAIATGNNASKHVCSRYLKKELPDLYGQKHAIETLDLIQDSLILLENEIWNLPEEDQATLVRVSIECPEIFESKKHRLMFLRCEQFNVDVSNRVSFWFFNVRQT